MKALLGEDGGVVRPLVEMVGQELREAERGAALAAEKGERTAAQPGYRSGSCGRTRVTRVAELELRDAAPAGDSQSAWLWLRGVLSLA